MFMSVCMRGGLEITTFGLLFGEGNWALAFGIRFPCIPCTCVLGVHVVLQLSWKWSFSHVGFFWSVAPDVINLYAKLNNVNEDMWLQGFNRWVHYDNFDKESYSCVNGSHVCLSAVVSSMNLDFDDYSSAVRMWKLGTFVELPCHSYN